MKAYLPKDDQELPDSYGITVHYVTGKSDKIQVVKHTILPNGVMSLWTDEDICNLIPIANVTRFEFDKNLTKILSLAEQKKLRDEVEAKAKQEIREKVEAECHTKELEIPSTRKKTGNGKRSKKQAA